MGKKKQILQLKKTDSYDGIKLKVYNSGSDGDRVVLKVSWQIQQLLNLYSDIAVLNWFLSLIGTKDLDRLISQLMV